MTTTLKAKLKNGVFLPSQPVDWPEGEEVLITRQSETAPVILTADPPDPETVKAIWEELTALAVVTGEPDFSGRDHDKILYGRPNGAW